MRYGGGNPALPGGSRKRRPFLIVSHDAFNRPTERRADAADQIVDFDRTVLASMERGALRKARLLQGHRDTNHQLIDRDAPILVAIAQALLGQLRARHRPQLEARGTVIGEKET